MFIHNTPEGIWQVYCRPFLNFSVGLFLFLSGMLSNVDNWHPRKRIIKVGIPYIIWTFIYVVLGNYKNIEEIPSKFVSNLLTGDAAAMMYYVFVYCEFTLLIPIIDKLAKSKYRWFGFILTPLEIVCMRLIPLITNYEMAESVEIIMGISCLGWFTYYYLGYLMGNRIINITITTKRLIILLIISVILQIMEGNWYLSMGEVNCGTQLKVTAILTGVLVSILAYRFIYSKNKYSMKVFKLLGDYSFGIYFSHIAVMSVLGIIPYYIEYVRYPFNALISVAMTTMCVWFGKKILGKYSKYLAL